MRMPWKRLQKELPGREAFFKDSTGCYPWLRLAAYALGGGIAVLVCAGALDRAGRRAQSEPIYGSIRAHRLEIVDQAGNHRVMLGVGYNGRPFLRLYNDSGVIMGGLNVLPDGAPSLSLRDKEGTENIALTVEPDRSAHLSFWDKVGGAQEGKERARIAVTSDSRSYLTLADAEGHLRADLSVSPGGDPRLVLFSEEDRLTWTVP